MKKIFFLSVFAIAALLVSCGDDVEDYIKHVPAPVEQGFSQKYPGMTTHRWAMDGEAYKGEFRNDQGQEVDSWFRPDGTWLRSETEIAPAALPQPVKDYVATAYTGFHIDDADYVETPQTSYYHLELDGRNDQEVEVNVYADGTPLDTPHPGEGPVSPSRIPDAVIAAFAEHHPGASVRKWEVEHGYYKAEFTTFEGRDAESYFTAEGTWAGTEYEYEGSLPVPIQSYLASNYPDFRVDDVEYVQTPTGDYYKIQIEKGDKAFTLLLTSDAVVWVK